METRCKFLFSFVFMDDNVDLFFFFLEGLGSIIFSVFSVGKCTSQSPSE